MSFSDRYGHSRRDSEALRTSLPPRVRTRLWNVARDHYFEGPLGMRPSQSERWNYEVELLLKKCWDELLGRPLHELDDEMWGPNPDIDWQAAALSGSNAGRKPIPLGTYGYAWAAYGRFNHVIQIDMWINRRQNMFVETIVHEAKHIAIWKCRHPGPEHTENDNHPDSKAFLRRVSAEVSYLRERSPTLQLFEDWIEHLWNPRLKNHATVEKAARNALAGKPVPD